MLLLPLPWAHTVCPSIHSHCFTRAYSSSLWFFIYPPKAHAFVDLPLEKNVIGYFFEISDILEISSQLNDYLNQVID